MDVEPVCLTVCSRYIVYTVHSLQPQGCELRSAVHYNSTRQFTHSEGNTPSTYLFPPKQWIQVLNPRRCILMIRHSTAIFQREGQNDVLTGLELGLVPFLQWRLDWMIFRWPFQINVRILLCYIPCQLVTWYPKIVSYTIYSGQSHWELYAFCKIRLRSKYPNI